MCGIAGYVLRNANADLPPFSMMCDRIRHR
jgi:asparagine synthetase B (glutamine-hydrolysing)